MRRLQSHPPRVARPTKAMIRRGNSSAGRPTATDRMIDAAIRGEMERQAPTAGERRRVRRVPYPAWVALLLVSPSGDRGRPIVLRSKDISVNGIRVLSRHMIYPGSHGVMQLMRSDGRLALIGVTVKTSRYAGNMEHQTGLQFSPLPRGWTAEEFIDRRGRMLLLHPTLRKNLEPEG